MTEFIKTAWSPAPDLQTVRASSAKWDSYFQRVHQQHLEHMERKKVNEMSEIPAPPEGASPAELAAWAVDTGRLDGTTEDGLASILASGRGTREQVMAMAPGQYDNRVATACRPLRQSIARLKAKMDAADEQPVAAARSRVAAINPIDAAFEAMLPPFPDEVARATAQRAVAASATPSIGGALPGASEALGQLYYAATGRQWTVRASASNANAPEPFAGSGDLPLATASGMDPKLLSKARWEDRWAIAKAPTMAEASQRLSDSVGIAADFGDIKATWPPTGLDDDATAYVRDYSRWLSTPGSV